MVPAAAAADVIPARTPETPGANGFELLPASAVESGAQNSAATTAYVPAAAVSVANPAAPAPVLVSDASGFQMIAAPQVFLGASEQLQLSAPAATPALADEARLPFASGTAPSLVADALAAAEPAVVLASATPMQLSAPAATPVLADAARLPTVSRAAPSLVADAPAAAEPAAAVVLASASPMQLSVPAATPAPADAARLSSASGTVPSLVADAPGAAEPVAAVVLASASPMQLRAPAMIAVVAAGPVTPVAGTAPALLAQPEPAALMLYPDFRMDVRPNAPTLVPGYIHRQLVAAVPAATVFAEPAVALQGGANAEPVHLLALARVQTDQRAAPEVVRFNAPSRLARLIPATVVEPAQTDADEGAAKVRIARAARLELGRSLQAHVGAAPKLDLVAFVPEAVALRALEKRQSDRRTMTARTAPVIAAADAAIATAPALERQRTSPDMSLAPWTANAAASAQTQALPVSAVADVAAARAEPGVIELAQADVTPPRPASAPPAAAAPAPAPAAGAPPPAGAAAPAAPAAAPAAPAPAPAPVVQRIIVQGNERIEPSTILSYLPIQVGDTVDAAKIDLAVKTLFRTELFADIALEMQGSDLIVKVSENPIINEVVFEGNHALKEDKLRDEVSVRPRGIFTRSKVEQDVQKIIELYRRSGRISATVTPKIVQLPQKRVDLIFEINEGPKSGILHINFVGNKSFSDTALRDVVVTRESHWYKFFQQHDNYDPDQVEYDREQLRKFYRNHGFYDFRVISAVAELAPDKNGFVETFTIDEGPKYHFGKVRVETELKRLNGELLAALLPIHSGQLYEDDRIEKATDALTYAAGANGFAFVDVRPRYVAHPETRTVDVTFDIKEGPRVYIERIDVVGNTQTLDYVIRREMRVAEGDAYNRVLVDRSKQQIKALGFFKDVDIEQLPGSSPDKTVLRVKVTEQPTGQLTFSIGYSSLEKLVGDIGISQTNFRGRGQRVDFQVSMGYLEKRVSLSFTEPRFQGRNMAAGFSIYTYNYNYATTASFTSSSTGIQLNTSFPVNQYASLGLHYAIHSDSVSVPSYVFDPTTHQCSAGYSQSLCDEVGTTFTSSIGYNLRLDRRNDPILPTRGFYMDFGQDFAGLGGVRYIRTIADGAWYYGFTPKWILSVQGQAGYITGWGGDSVRINDRFYKGGDTFRGFQIAGIGPRDNTLLATGQCGTAVTNPSSTSAGCFGSSLGAKAYAIGTVELQVPNPIPAQYGIKTALFSDFGTAGLLDAQTKRNPDGTVNPYIQDNLAFRASVGVSVFWKSPMGPLRFDFSKVLKQAPYDVKETFYFSTATQFQ
jgi:outer membrane protein insertion porin family